MTLPRATVVALSCLLASCRCAEVRGKADTSGASAEARPPAAPAASDPPPSTWVEVEGGDSGFTAIIATPEGAWFASGTSSARAGAEPRWFVARSTDAGRTWVPDDSLQGAGTGEGSCSRLVIGRDNAVFGAGFSVVGGQRTWIVRRRAADGAWSTVDRVAPDGGEAEAHALAAGPDGVLWAGGGVGRPLGEGGVGTSGTRAWVVRRSVDQGVSWSEVLRLDGGSDPYPTSIVTPSAGVVIVAGVASGPKGPEWRVLRSTDGGATWTPSALPGKAPGGEPLAALLVDGVVYVAGAEEANGVVRPLVLVSRDDGASFVESPAAGGPPGSAVRALAPGAGGLLALVAPGIENAGEWAVLSLGREGWSPVHRWRPADGTGAEPRALLSLLPDRVVAVGFARGAQEKMHAVVKTWAQPVAAQPGTR